MRNIRESIWKNDSNKTNDMGMDRVIIMMWMVFPERSGLSAR